MFYGQCWKCGERWGLGTTPTCVCPEETTKPPRQWVDLTDEKIKALASWWPSYDQIPALMVLAKDIQNSLKEKNT